MASPMGMMAMGLASTANRTAGTSRALSYQYDLAGRMTRLTWPDAFYVTYERDAKGGDGDPGERVILAGGLFP